MKAQKTCPGCQAQVHARRSSCDCGHVFYEKKAKPEAKPKTEGAGRGKKQCPSCQAYVGIRNAVCPHCQTAFVPKVKENNPAIIRPNPASTEKPVRVAKGEEQKQSFKITAGTGNTNLKVCLVPAGTCPVKVTDWTKEGLLEWARKVQLEEEKKGYALANEGLAYWARTFYTFFRDTDKEALVKETFPVDKEGI